ncbi:hypothetical protein AXG93_1247s1260 [Marchantia polymorpha subsp. ruderalis]|uniref:Uncharacterized protein n=1 Tax=Marchantia polymorpha subsp. ruderalis TaxID=1480154 RepID=A0A176WPT0_MARPO|nr:hypothetical protein AXG93_1247s1260 [Marchantia polymorpha subsp. ruderalis]
MISTYGAQSRLLRRKISEDQKSFIHVIDVCQQRGMQAIIIKTLTSVAKTPQVMSFESTGGEKNRLGYHLDFAASVLSIRDMEKVKICPKCKNVELHATLLKRIVNHVLNLSIVVGFWSSDQLLNPKEDKVERRLLYACSHCSYQIPIENNIFFLSKSRTTVTGVKDATKPILFSFLFARALSAVTGGRQNFNLVAV